MRPTVAASRRRGACKPRAHLFDRYLALGSVRLLEAELRTLRITVPRCTTITGKPVGGGAFTRGQLYHLLRNVTYTGRIGHKDKTYPGLHKPIVEPEMFEAVQAVLASNLQGSRTRASAASPSMLANRIVDDAGEPLIATHASKGKVRYRYYVSRSLQQETSDVGVRIPAREMESLVAARLAEVFDDPLALAAHAWLDVPPDRIEELHWRYKELHAQMHQRRSPALLAIITQVQVAVSQVTISCDGAALATMLQAERLVDAPATIVLTCPARLTRSGKALRLVQDNGIIVGAAPDRSLVKLLVRARQWWGALRTGTISPTELAAREGVTRSYVARVVRLAFLAPAVTEAILAGRQRAGVTVASFTVENAIPASWAAQKALMLPARSVVR